MVLLLCLTEAVIVSCESEKMDALTRYAFQVFLFEETTPR